MKRILLISLTFGLALIFIVACTQATPTPTQAPPTVEETTEAPPTETLAPSPTETATEVEETEPPATETPTEEPTEAPGGEDVEALIIDRCSECHSTDRIFRADKTESEWNATIDRMVGYGADVNEDEKNQMIDWLLSRDE